MIRVPCGLATLAVALTVTVGGRAFAQEPAAAPAAPPREVSDVRDELVRLKADFEALRRQYDERLSQLEQRLRQLGAGPLVLDAAPTTPAVQPAAAVVPQDPVLPAIPIASPASAATTFNPEMSAIGNFVGVAGRNPFDTAPSLQLREAEVSLRAVIDPYARADFFFAAGPEGLEIEEGFATFTALPGQLLLKVGKLRAQFGKVNTLHTHAMPTADRPLVTTNLVGGEEGLSDGGVSLSKLIDNPFMFLEATGEVFAGTGDVFQSTRRARPTVVGRLRAYRDLSEDKNLDLGASWARGQTDVGIDDGLELHKQLFGFDATFRYRPLRRAIY